MAMAVDSRNLLVQAYFHLAVSCHPLESSTSFLAACSRTRGKTMEQMVSSPAQVRDRTVGVTINNQAQTNHKVALGTVKSPAVQVAARTVATRVAALVVARTAATRVATLTANKAPTRTTKHRTQLPALRLATVVSSQKLTQALRQHPMLCRLQQYQ